MIVEVSVVPIGVGESLSGFVKEALKVIKERGIRHELNAMGTVLEIDSFEELCDILEEIRRRLEDKGCSRIYFVVKVDWSRKKRTIDSKIESVLHFDTF